MADGDLLPTPEAVFFLTGDELPAAVRDRLPRHDTVTARRAEQERALANPGPASFGTPPGDPPSLDALPKEAARSMKAIIWATNNIFGTDNHTPAESPAAEGVRGMGAAPAATPAPPGASWAAPHSAKTKPAHASAVRSRHPVGPLSFPAMSPR